MIWSFVFGFLTGAMAVAMAGVYLLLPRSEFEQ